MFQEKGAVIQVEPEGAGRSPRTDRSAGEEEQEREEWTTSGNWRQPLETSHQEALEQGKEAQLCWERPWLYLRAYQKTKAHPLVGRGRNGRSKTPRPQDKDTTSAADTAPTHWRKKPSRKEGRQKLLRPLERQVWRRLGGGVNDPQHAMVFRR